MNHRLIGVFKKPRSGKSVVGRLFVDICMGHIDRQSLFSRHELSHLTQILLFKWSHIWQGSRLYLPITTQTDKLRLVPAWLYDVTMSRNANVSYLMTRFFNKL
ncbi:unnamed protein product [Fusarium graminearum]|nr:unnamed protein product [Fusarium graminearum]